jgi:hypothetical protein
MEKLKELQKKFNLLSMNKSKICAHLSDNEIDKAIDSEDFNFIANTLYEYFEDKDIGYILTKFKETGLEDKITDIDFSYEEWVKVQDDIKNEIKQLSDKFPDKNLNKEDYIGEMIKNRKNEIR